MTSWFRAIAATLAVIALTTHAAPAQAGCGCEKPPPPLASIRPAFAAPGSEITLFSAEITDGATYAVTFRSMSGEAQTVTAAAIVRKDFADGILKPQLVVAAPAGEPGPTAVTVTAGGATILEIPQSDFTLLQDAIQMTEDNGETISKCYRAAVGTDGTVYFPLDVSAIGQRTIFSGAAKGYRFTFDAEDITIYNRQGVLMQTLGPEESGIFTIEDDQFGDGTVHADVFTGDPRLRSDVAYGDGPGPHNSNGTGRIDFDPSPSRELYEAFDVFPDFGLLSGRPGIGTGMPASGGIVFEPGWDRETAFGVLEASWRSLRRPGDRVGVSADVRFPDAAAGASAVVGVYSNLGGMAMFGVRPDRAGAMKVFVDTGRGIFWSSVLESKTSFTTNWLRLSVVFTYTGENIHASGRIFDIGPAGAGPGRLIGKVAGKFENSWLEGNRKIQRGFGAIAGSGSPHSDIVYLDNFVDGAAHDPDDGVDNAPIGGSNDPGTDTPAPGTDDPAPGTDDPAPGTDDPAPGTDTPTAGDPAPGSPVDGTDEPGTDPADDPATENDGGADADPDDANDEPGADGDGSDDDHADDSAVDETVRSFRLTYDRHQFLTYEALHAVDPSYLASAEDSEWHANGSRHIDHDYLIVAVRGLVDGAFAPPPGETPPFNLHLTTVLADAPLGEAAPPRVLNNNCDGDTNAAPVGLCGAVPQAECRGPAQARKAKLALKNAKKDAGDALVWNWDKGQATDAADFGDPLSTDESVLCIYDESAATSTLVFRAAAPAGGICEGDQSCWRKLGKGADGGYAYEDAGRASDGLAEMLLKPGSNRKARILVTAKGEKLALPPLPLALPARVQLQTTNGGCWEATYSTKGAKKNNARRFKAKAD
jgi:hypothetical protein